MHKLINRWNDFWFAPGSAQNLGFCRLFVMLGGFVYYRGTDFETWGVFRYEFWQPIPLFRHLHLHPLSPVWMLALGRIWKASLLLGGIGLFSRLSCAVAFGLGLYLLGLPLSLGKLNHGDIPILWSFLVLAIARSGDAWSIDLLIRRGRGPNLSPHAEYRWPVRLMQVLLVGIFLLSGIAKLRVAGLHWALSDNFQRTLIACQYLGDPIVDWGAHLARHPIVCQTMAMAALLAEISAPLALTSPLFAWILIPSLFLMQIGNEVLLGVAFRQFMICYVFWIPWNRAGSLFKRNRNSSPNQAAMFSN